jgi:APA family basic amino acid/polyamine antiporter
VTPSSGAAVARPIGLWTAVALVLGNMIGSGVFLLPSSLAPYGGGISLLGWLVSAAGSLLLALVFARLARVAPAAGGPYAYTRMAFGDFAGFLVAWGYWISTWATLAAVAVALVGYLDPFLPSVVRDRALAGTLAIGIVWLLILVNIGGVGLAGRVQVLTTAIKIVPLAVIGLAGLTAFEPTRFGIAAAPLAETGRSTMAVVTLTLWAFLGLETGTIPAAHTADPQRTIPRATIIGTLVAAGIYILSTVGVMSLIPPDTLASSTAPFADAARIAWGEGAARLVAAGAAISCFGALNGWTLMAGQLPLAVARDRLFPDWFARVSGRDTPSLAMIVAGVLTTLLVVMNSTRGLVELFTFVILLSTLGTLIPYLFCSLATFRVGGAPGRRGGATAGTAAIAAGAFVYALVAVGGAGADVVYWGFLLLIAGLPVYVWVTRASARLSPPVDAA